MHKHKKKLIRNKIDDKHHNNRQTNAHNKQQMDPTHPQTHTLKNFSKVTKTKTQRTILTNTSTIKTEKRQQTKTQRQTQTVNTMFRYTN